jgi:predicted SAM-dependent methyltransferase
MSIKKVIKPLVPKSLIMFKNLLSIMRPNTQRNCPVCGYHGYFELFGWPPRIDARCTNCGSLERHRLFWLWYDNDRPKLKEPILHFAPEKIFKERLINIYKNYVTADLYQSADLKLNIENIELETASIRTVICNHVLEHVDDKKALSEIERILTDDGILICSVPIIEGWATTYENSNVTSDIDRELHFGQYDHVRYYGSDFRGRLKDAGFKSIQEYTAKGEDVVTYALQRGEKFFICKKY